MAIVIFYCHRHHINRPIGVIGAPLAKRLHGYVYGATLEVLNGVVEIVNFAFGKDNKHIAPACHHVDGIAFRLCRVAASLYRKGA
ncbi:MAG: hypothetical protein BWY75_02734 [bacterium ADurb.Bin425]|nr:MAG: hypothetical protein BWY75_02734 [bacterium ADurb.Bin425]